MRKLKWFCGLAGMLCVSLFCVSGCSTKGKQNDAGGIAPAKFSAAPEVDSGDVSEDTDVPETEQKPEEQIEEMSEEERKEREVRDRLDKQTFSDGNHLVEVLGFQEYKKLEGPKFTDEEKSGKVYLVLFLSIRNSMNKEVYFNPYGLEAEIDGTAMENAVLANEPEGYPTIFTNVGAEKSVAGFVCWLVPKDWKKLHLKYIGFSTDGSADMEMEFTRKDFLIPTAYNKTQYAKG